MIKKAREGESVKSRNRMRKTCIERADSLRVRRKLGKNAHHASSPASRYCSHLNSSATVWLNWRIGIACLPRYALSDRQNYHTSRVPVLTLAQGLSLPRHAVVDFLCGSLTLQSCLDPCILFDPLCVTAIVLQVQNAIALACLPQA